MSDPICPCEGFDHPKVIFNAPGLDQIDYRVGDFVAFRHALLLALDGEINLRDWRPGASGDLAVQMVEWWAYVSDVLTFYNWRIFTNGFLRTADEPESVNRLVRLLGYRPRPGLGSTGLVAFMIDGNRQVGVPQGFQLLSKPKPGQAPQTFETDAAITLNPPTDLQTLPKPTGKLLDAGGAVTLLGTRDSIKTGEWLLLVKKSWSGGAGSSAWAKVKTVEFTKDPLGAAQTRVSFETAPALSTALASDFLLMRGLQSMPFWHFGDSKPADPNFVASESSLHLTSLARPSNTGELVLIRIDGKTPTLLSIGSSVDTVWWRNDPDKPDVAPDPTKTIPLSVIHSRLGILGINACWNDTGNVVYDWRIVGDLVPAPQNTITGPTASLLATTGVFPATQEATVIIEDANGLSSSATGYVGGSPASEIDLSKLPSGENFVSPINVHLGVASISRGFSVPNEVLGDGDATIEQPEFKLKKSPVTYLAGNSNSGDGYQSTIRIWVNGVEYHEVPTLYSQPQGAQVFVTREDDEGFTHVKFASALQTGIGNVVASYRIESGADLPGQGDVSIITHPIQGIKKAIASTVVTPGADSDPADKVRKLAPLSVLTFGRAVSGDDYETIAALAPGVTRAKSYYGWDPETQRAAVKVYVGDTQGALDSAKEAIGRTSDPNRPAEILRARPVLCATLFSLIVESNYVWDQVEAEVRAALVDPVTGLFGAQRLGIGESIFESEIMAACLAVPGVKAIHGFEFGDINGSVGPRLDPGEGAYYAMPQDYVGISNGEKYVW